MDKEDIKTILLTMIKTNSCECIVGCNLCPVKSMCGHIPYLEFHTKKGLLACLYGKENNILIDAEIFEAML